MLIHPLLSGEDKKIETDEECIERREIDQRIEEEIIEKLDLLKNYHLIENLQEYQIISEIMEYEEDN